MDGRFRVSGHRDLRSHPRDAEAHHKSREKDLLAKIDDLTMQMDASIFTLDYQFVNLSKVPLLAKLDEKEVLIDSGMAKLMAGTTNRKRMCGGGRQCPE